LFFKQQGVIDDGFEKLGSLKTCLGIVKIPFESKRASCEDPVVVACLIYEQIARQKAKVMFLRQRLCSFWGHLRLAGYESPSPGSPGPKIVTIQRALH
jgi:hypothetical protein